jgi:hypothetical protein
VHRGELGRTQLGERVPREQVVVDRAGEQLVVEWSAALRSGELVLHGEAQARRALPRWLKLSAFAGTPRPVGLAD